MKKVLAVILAVILFLVVGIGLYSCFFNNTGNTRVSNDKAEKNSQERYITIINETNQVINEVHITVGEGTEIESAFQKNPDEKSFSVKIPKDYDEYDTFTVILYDRYGLKYQKTSKISQTGRTEVKISEEDYVKQDGDFKRKLDKFFNGDGF